MVPAKSCVTNEVGVKGMDIPGRGFCSGSWQEKVKFRAGLARAANIKEAAAIWNRLA